MDDLISRQAAIDMLYHVDEYNGRSIEAIRNLPSAQPEGYEWCHDCKEYDQERHSCPRWNKVIRQTVEDLKASQPEIVRCKDCIRYGKDNCFMKIQMLWELKPDDFCSYAERRQDEDDQTAGL